MTAPDEPRSASEPPGRAARVHGLPAVMVTAAGFAAVVLIVLLPVLVAGASINRPPSEAERALVRSVGSDSGGGQPGPFRSFVELWLEPVETEAEVDGRVTRARLGALALLFATSILTFSSVSLALSRGFAALSCIALALSPALQTNGVTLRPESLGLLFAQLGCAVLLLLPRQQAGRPRGFPLAAALAALSAGACYALCVSSVPRQAVAFGVPVTCALLTVLRAGRGFVQIAQRTRFRILPFRSFRRRSGPYVLASAATLLAALAFLRSDPPISRGAGLFGSHWSLELIGRALVFAGVFGWLPALIRQWSRQTYLTAPVVLFVHSAILASTSWSLEEQNDHSLAVPGVAVFAAYGSALVAFVFGRFVIGRRLAARTEGT